MYTDSSEAEKQKPKFLVFGIFLACVFFVFSFFAAHAAGTPAVISYQGRLADSSGNLLGGAGATYHFKFSIWDNPTVGNGTRLWPSAVPSSFPAVVRDGVFNVNIGDTAAGYPHALDYDFSTQADVYLQVEVSADNVTFQTLSPRQRVGSAPFAELARAVSGTLSSSFGTTTPFAGAQINVEATSTASKLLALRARAGQTANIFEIQDGTGTGLFFVNNTGGLFASSTLQVSGETQLYGLLTAPYASTTALSATTLCLGGDCRTVWPVEDGTFSTTSADFWATLRNFFSTTSATFWETQQTARTADDLSDNSIEDLNDVAAMTENYGDLLYWNGTAWADIATSSLGLAQLSNLDAYLSLASWYATTTDALDEGSTNLWYTADRDIRFSTTSADYWKSVSNFFSTTSSDYWKSVNNFFSTTSADYWKSVNNFFSTTSSDYWKSVNNFFSTTSADAYINASSTIANASGVASGNVLQWNGTKWVSVATTTLGFIDTNEWTDGGAFDYNLENVYVGTSTEVANQPLFVVGTSSALLSVSNVSGRVGIGTTTPASPLHIPIASNSIGITLGNASNEGIGLKYQTQSGTPFLVINNGSGGGGALEVSGGIIKQTSGFYAATAAGSGSRFDFVSGVLFGWSSSSNNPQDNAKDLILRRGGAANLVFGNADAASPVAQTLSVQSVSSGTSDTAGANWTFNGSRSTGNAVGGSIIFQTSPAGASGSTVNSLVEAMRVSGTGNVGIGTTTPGYKLTVAGDAMLTGALQDNSYSAGTNGMVLQTTGTGIAWVATSSLGITQDLSGYFALTDWYATTTDALDEGSTNLWYTADRDIRFSTTSADYWKSVSNFFSTTSSDYWKSVNNFFSTTSAEYFINASSTIANAEGVASGNVLQWNGTRWVSVSTTTLGLSLQAAYNTAGTIETAAGTPVVITETTAGISSVHDLLQLTANPGSGGSYSGNALKITMSDGGADSNSGNAIRIIKSTGTMGSAILFEDAIGSLFNIDATGQTTIGNSTTRSGLNTYGKIGVGTTSPFAKLSVHAIHADSLDMLFAVASSTLTSTTTLFSVDRTGLTTIGSAGGTLDAVFQIASDANAWSIGYSSSDKSFRIASSTNLSANVFFELDKGGALFLSSGLSAESGSDEVLCIDPTTFEITRGGASCAASSIRFKENIEDIAYGLDEVMRLRPISFEYNEQERPNSDTRYLGFIAEEMLDVLPEVVEIDSQGLPGGIDYAKITPVLARAIQELNVNLMTLASTTASTTPQSKSFTESFFDNMFTRLSTWFADATNGIADFFANRVRTQELCIGEEGNETCLTKVELDALLAAPVTSGGTGGSSTGGSTPIEPPVEEPPAEEPPTEEPPTEEPPVEEPPVEEPPVEEPPVEEPQIEEPPAEESPVGEISAEELAS